MFSNKVGKKSNETVSSFLQRMRRITCSHENIISFDLKLKDRTSK